MIRLLKFCVFLMIFVFNNANAMFINPAQDELLNHMKNIEAKSYKITVNDGKKIIAIVYEWTSQEGLPSAQKCILVVSRTNSESMQLYCSDIEHVDAVIK